MIGLFAYQILPHKEICKTRAFIEIGLLVLVFCSFSMASRAAQQSIEGHWEGVMVREGAELSVAFDFVQESGQWKGTYSCEAQRALGIPLRSIQYTDPKLYFELVGDTIKITFEGKASNDRIDGEFREDTLRGKLLGKGTFSLKSFKPRPPQYKQEEVRFNNGEVALSGTLFLPLTKGPHPAVVFLHGSGPEGRWASRFLATRFAEHGIVTLIYDKRGVAASGGDWRQSNFYDLAGDALAGVQLLQSRAEVNPKKIGLYGQSQGGMIASLVASCSTDVTFIIGAATYGGRLSEQDIYHIRNQRRAAGYTDAEIEQAIKYYKLYIKVARTGEGWDELDAATQRVRNERWFSSFQPPPKDHWTWKFHRNIGDYNTLEAWEKVRVPVLLVWGERDQTVPAAESIVKIERALKKAGNKDYAIFMLPRAEHNLTISSEPGETFEWWHLAPGYTDLLIAWIKYRFGDRK